LRNQTAPRRAACSGSASGACRWSGLQRRFHFVSVRGCAARLLGLPLWVFYFAFSWNYVDFYFHFTV
jgi:hypothetical protein